MNITYFNYTGRNTESHGVNINGIKLYFSYKTLVAFYYKGELFVRKNEWGTTTGRHLNDIDGGNKKERLSEEEFDKAIEKYLKKHRLLELFV
jgi:hypothetical protein